MTGTRGLTGDIPTHTFFQRKSGVWCCCSPPQFWGCLPPRRRDFVGFLCCVYKCEFVWVFARVLACAYLSLPFSFIQDEPAMLLQAPWIYTLISYGLRSQCTKELKTSKLQEKLLQFGHELSVLQFATHHVYTNIPMYVGFKTLFYVFRHLDSTAPYLPTGLHLGFFRSWPSLYLPSSFSSVFLVLSFVSASTSLLFRVIFLLPFFGHGRTM